MSNIPVQFKTDKNCHVVLGEWYDPYSGKTFINPNMLDLDHIVPMKFAHDHGGNKWSRNERQIFANDRQNLILVKTSLNRQKGAKGLHDWLPPNHIYRCRYIERFIDIIKNISFLFFQMRKE